MTHAKFRQHIRYFRFLLFVGGVLSIALPLGGQTFPSPVSTPKAAFDRELDALRVKEAADLERLVGQYKGALTRLWEGSRQAGALDAVLAVQKEQERFAASGKVLMVDVVEKPPELRRIMETYHQTEIKIRVLSAKSYVSLFDRYDAALERMQAQLTREGRLEDALKIRFDRESVKLVNEYRSAIALSAEYVDIDSPLAFSRMKLMPVEEGDLLYAGLRWKPMRVQFEAKGHMLSTLPAALDPARYGHGPAGIGRGAAIFTNIGNKHWKDYVAEFEFCITGADPAFVNRAPRVRGISGGFRFYVAKAHENRFQQGHSFYGFTMHGTSGWALAAQADNWMQRPLQELSIPSSYSNTRLLGQGIGLTRNRQDGNLFRIEVSGKTIRIWVDGKQLVEIEDALMGQETNGIRLDHGGFGFEWAEENMGWVRNFSIKPL